MFNLIGTIETTEGTKSYSVLPLTWNFDINTRNVLLAEFWQDENKPYLYAIAPGACPPVHSEFKFSSRIYANGLTPVRFKSRANLIHLCLI